MNLLVHYYWVYCKTAQRGSERLATLKLPEVTCPHCQMLFADAPAHGVAESRRVSRAWDKRMPAKAPPPRV